MLQQSGEALTVAQITERLTPTFDQKEVRRALKHLHGQGLVIWDIMGSWGLR